jgi:hypothetical protein
MDGQDLLGVVALWWSALLDVIQDFSDGVGVGECFRSIKVIWARHGHKISPYAAVNNGCVYDCHLLKAKHLYRVHLPSDARHELPCLQSLQD